MLVSELRQLFSLSTLSKLSFLFSLLAHVRPQKPYERRPQHSYETSGYNLMFKGDSSSSISLPNMERKKVRITEFDLPKQKSFRLWNNTNYYYFSSID